MLSELLNLPWKDNVLNYSEIVVILDEQFSEVFSSRAVVFPPEITVLSLTSCTPNEIQFLSFRPKTIVAFSSTLDNPTALSLQSIFRNLDNCQSHIFTSVSEDAAFGLKGFSSKIHENNEYSNKSRYTMLIDFLYPAHVEVSYFPVHTVNLLSSQSKPATLPGSLNVDLELGLLSSLNSRRAQPLTLSSLHHPPAGVNSDHASNREYDSVWDVNASDLPEGMKAGLKAMAHDLAGALIFDYGLDVTASVYALGKTSSILGHNILPILELLLETRSAFQSPTGLALHSALLQGLPTNTSPPTPLQPAALVLVDRTEDLITPASSGSAVSDGASSLAHRILNTLNYCQYSSTTPTETSGSSTESMRSLRCNILLEAPILREENLHNVFLQLGVNEIPGTRECCKDWNIPMTALTNLPLQLNPSLIFSAAEVGDGSDVSKAMMIGSEEAGKTAICSALRQAINAEGGTMPPAKKRGLGAEVLALVQALIQAPGAPCPLAPSPNPNDTASAQDEDWELVQALDTYRSDMKVGLGYNYVISIRYQNLLTLSLALIESMQRSSGKQFAQICPWQCAYDVRTAREIELDRTARKYQDFDICIAHLITYFFSNKVSTTTAVADQPLSPSKKSDTGKSKSAAAEKDALATAGPVDLVHILAQLIRLVSLFRQTSSSIGSSSNFSALADCIVEHLLTDSGMAELEYLKGLRFLQRATVKAIQSSRLCVAELNKLTVQQVELLASASAADEIESRAEGLEKEIARLELQQRQLQSAVRDQVHTMLLRLGDLQRQYGAHLQTQLSSPLLKGTDSGTGIGGMRLLDLLSPALDPTSNGTEEIAGLLARIAQAYLSKRGELLRSQNLFAQHSADVAATSRSAIELGEGLGRVLELVESPLQKIKRAGLGLLSQGLGSLGFGFGSQVTANAVSAPHPAEQAVLVLFVLGGVSYKEVTEIQRILSAQVLPNTRIVILSTRMVGTENICYSFFS